MCAARSRLASLAFDCSSAQCLTGFQLPDRARYAPYGNNKVFKCSTCKSLLNREGLFCHNCAYMKGGLRSTLIQQARLQCDTSRTSMRNLGSRRE